MQQVIKIYNLLFGRRFMRYLFIGGSTFLIDFGGLIILHAVFKVNLLVAASISYWVSILFNFLMNRHWTFSSKDTSNLHKHIIGYGVLLGINYAFTIGFIGLLTHWSLNYMIAKILATAIQMSWTYYAYKHYVFR